MQTILHTFQFCEHNFHYVQAPCPTSHAVTHEVVGVTKDDSEFLYSNEELLHAVFEYGRIIWLSKKDELKEESVPSMTLDEAQKLGEGMEVNYQGYSCLIRKVMFFGGNHPYWILAPEMGMPKQMRVKVGGGPISYAACQPVGLR
jgi:hypothetical protein